MLTILIEEEYGYRYWRWTYPASIEQLIQDFQAGMLPVVCARGDFKGEIEQVAEELADDFYFNEFCHSAGLRAHIHDSDDSWLEINGEFFHGYQDKTNEEVIE